MDDETPLRLEAYYYSFEATGVRAVDLILAAVASAGKAYHHTQYWSDRDDEETPSCIDKIQKAANECAALMTASARPGGGDGAMSDWVIHVNPGVCCGPCGKKAGDGTMPSYMYLSDDRSVCYDCADEAIRKAFPVAPARPLPETER